MVVKVIKMRYATYIAMLIGASAVVLAVLGSIGVVMVLSIIFSRTGLKKLKHR